MEKSSKLKLVGLTLAGLSVLASGSALAASLKVGGSAQTDYVWFDDSVSQPFRAGSAATGTDLGFDTGANVTQANLVLRGTLMDRWVYNVSANFGRPGPLVEDAWVGWDKYDPWFRFSLGRFNASQGLENTGNRSSYTFVTPAAGQRTFVNGRVNGLSVEGNPFMWWGYQASVGFHTGTFFGVDARANGVEQGFGSNVDNSAQVVVSNVGNNQGYVSGRTFLQPLVKPGKVIHVGGTYTWAQTKGDVTLNAAPGGYFANTNAPLVRLTTAATGNAAAGTARTDDYRLWGLEGLAIWGPFHVQAEYMNFDLDSNVALTRNAAGATTTSVEADGWYAQASWVLTGESRNYDPVSGTVGKVNPRNAKWGAWELGVRYDQVNLDRSIDISSAALATGAAGTGFDSAGTNGGSMHDWTVGLNWYPNKNVKLMANYTWAEGKYADGAAGTGANFESVAADPDTKRRVNVFAVKGQVDF